MRSFVILNVFRKTNRVLNLCVVKGGRIFHRFAVKNRALGFSQKIEFNFLNILVSEFQFFDSRTAIHRKPFC